MNRFLLVLFFIFSSTANVLCKTYRVVPYDTIFVSVSDIRRNCGIFKICITPQMTSFSFMYLSENEDKKDYVWVTHDVEDINDSTRNYLRNGVMHFFYYKDKRKYRYYKKLGYTIDYCPGLPSITIKRISAKQNSTSEVLDLTGDVESDKPCCNGVARIIYTKEYARFLKTLLGMTFIYTKRYKGDPIEISPGYWVWPFWE